jgi:hypothetical protein
MGAEAVRLQDFVIIQSLLPAPPIVGARLPAIAVGHPTLRHLTGPNRRQAALLQDFMIIQSLSPTPPIVGARLPAIAVGHPTLRHLT